MPARLSSEIEGEIVRLYTTPLADGSWLGSTTIGRQFDIAPGTVRNVIRRAGLPTRSSAEAYANGKRVKPITRLPRGAPPLCKCGCGTPVEWQRRKNNWYIYAVGHYRPPAPFKNSEWLKAEYVDKRRTAEQIAADFGVSSSTICRYLKLHAIPIRTHSESLIGRHAGSKNPAWKGGVTPERQRLYRSLRWKRLLQDVFTRDGYHCVRCNAPKRGRGSLHAHHIRAWADAPDSRMELDNLITLCRSCHAWVHSKANTKREFLPLL